MTRYKNKLWPQYGTEFYETEDPGTEYHDYMVYLRKDGKTGVDVYDIVKDGVCLTQTKGMGGAFRAIDEMRIDAMINWDFK